MIVMSTRSTRSALGWWGRANIIRWILRCVIPYSCLTLNVSSTTGQRNYLRQPVRNDQLLSDSHRLPCCQGFKQHLLFDLDSVSESGLNCTEKTTGPSYCLIRRSVCDWKLLDLAGVVHLIYCENLICRWLYAAVPPAAPRPPAAPQGYRCQWSRPGRFSSYSGCYPGEGWPTVGRKS